jgi:hypothetical protein
MTPNYISARLRAVAVCVVLVARPLAPPPLEAQKTEELAPLLVPGPLFDFSVETRIGAVVPQRARTGFDGQLEWNVGSLGVPYVRPVLGLDVYHADLTSETGGIPGRGSITSAGAVAALRIDANRDGDISPYVATGLSADYTWANAPVRATERDLEGARLGFALGGGAAVWLGTSPFAVTIDLRHVFSPGMSRTTFTVGGRVQPRVSALKRQLNSQGNQLENAVERAIEDLIHLSVSLPDVAGVVDAARGLEILLGGDLFLTGTAELTQRATRELSEIGAVLERFPNSPIVVDLRAQVARACIATALAEQRARAIRRQLIEAGVGGERFIDPPDAEDVTTASTSPNDGRSECGGATITIVGVHRARTSSAR